MLTLEDLYRRNFRQQRGIVALASGVGLVLALAPHNERAIFIIDGLPSAFAAVPVELPLEPPSVMITEGGGIGGPLIDEPLDPRFVRALGGRPPAPGAPAGSPATGPGAVGPVGPGALAAAPPFSLPVGAGPGTQLAGLAPGGPFVGSPLGPGFSSSPVGPATGDPAPPTGVDPVTPPVVVPPTPTPTPTASPTPTPSPTPNPDPTPTAPPTPTPSPTPTTPPTPTPTPTTPVTPIDPPAQPPIVPAVPEPLTWVLMIVGFFGCGSVLRRQRSAKVQSIAAKGDELETSKGALSHQ